MLGLLISLILNLELNLKYLPSWNIDSNFEPLNLFQAFYIEIIFLFKEKSFQYLIRFNSSSANLHKIGYQICKVFLDVFWSEIYHFTSKLNATIMDEKRKIYIIYFGSHIVGDLLKCKAIGIHRLTWFPIAWFHLARIFKPANWYY